MTCRGHNHNDAGARSEHGACETTRQHESGVRASWSRSTRFYGIRWNPGRFTPSTIVSRALDSETMVGRSGSSPQPVRRAEVADPPRPRLRLEQLLRCGFGGIQKHKMITRRPGERAWRIATLVTHFVQAARSEAADNEATVWSRFE